MSTTHKSEKPPEWGKWGEESERAPALKEYIELLIKFNRQQREILQETKEWLLNTSGNNSH